MNGFLGLHKVLQPNFFLWASRGVSDGCPLGRALIDGFINGLVLGCELGCDVGQSVTGGCSNGWPLGPPTAGRWAAH